MKYVSKNRNYASLIYYAINDHMYLVRDAYKNSLAARAREENKLIHPYYRDMQRLIHLMI
jgi:hypothetical protein